jgi:hypothetical protein
MMMMLRDMPKKMTGELEATKSSGQSGSPDEESLRHRSAKDLLLTSVLKDPVHRDPPPGWIPDPIPGPIPDLSPG